jgi:methionine synthase II (cobalamin-independent)
LDSDGCEENKICTEEFRTISLEITNQDGDAVVLDDFYTFLDSRKKFEYTLNDFHTENGIYPVLTDAEMDEVERQGTTLIFVGEKAGKNIVEHQMVIGHDCCHVILIEGDDKIVIEE